jgi:esterase/lipase superfamily enzyme
LGPDHPNVGLPLNNLGELYGQQRRYAEAEALIKRSLSIKEKAQGPDHPDVATPLNNLALLYYARGRYSEAEPLYKRSLAIREKAQGADHPDVFVSLINLAELYRSQGRTAEAEPLFERAKAIPQSDVKELAILFATNRRRDTGKPGVAFGGERGDGLIFGQGVVVAGREQISRRSERYATGAGTLDKSAALTSERLLRIRRIVPADTAVQPFARLRPGTGSQPAGERQALVFVHGYNVDFESALKRIAQIAFDLDFSGTCLLFSWPSKAKLLRYVYDRDSADIAVNHLIEFLDVAAEQMPNTRFHFLAHSMGNVVLLSALEKIALRGGSKSRIALGEIVLAHPDVDQDRFRQLAKSIKDLAPRVTLYTSSNDRATWVSKIVGGSGRAGGVRIIVPSVDTIDISGLGTSLWSTNHNVYASNPLLFGDMGRLIASGQRPPEQRTWFFEAVKTVDGVYWRYRAPMVAEAPKR